MEQTERKAKTNAQQSHISASRGGQLQLLLPHVPHLPHLWLKGGRCECLSSLGKRDKAGPKPWFPRMRIVHKKLVRFFWASNHCAMAKKLHMSELIICIKNMVKQEDNTLNPCWGNTPILINFNQIYLCLAKNLGGESSCSNFNPNCCWKRQSKNEVISKKELASAGIPMPWAEKTHCLWWP